MFGILLIYTKAGYYLSLIDQVAPLIDIIKRIFLDMRWFIIVFMIFGYAFAGAFFVIA